jgi:hypothetical protein
MRVLVCGGRDYPDSGRDSLFASLDRLLVGATWLIHGDARGVDRLAGQWAHQRGIPVTPFPANWNAYGKRAGWLRNQEMLDIGKPDLVIAFPGGGGTADMVRRARKAGVRVVSL